VRAPGSTERPVRLHAPVVEVEEEIVRVVSPADACKDARNGAVGPINPGRTARERAAVPTPVHRLVETGRSDERIVATLLGRDQEGVAARATPRRIWCYRESLARSSGTHRASETANEQRDNENQGSQEPTQRETPSTCPWRTTPIRARGGAMNALVHRVDTGTLTLAPS